MDTSLSFFKVFPVGKNLFYIPDSVLTISKAFPLSAEGCTFLNPLCSGTQRQTLSLALEKSQVKPKKGRRSEVLF